MTFKKLPMYATFRFTDMVLEVPRYASGSEKALANVEGPWIKTQRGTIHDAVQSEPDKNARSFFNVPPNTPVEEIK